MESPASKNSREVLTAEVAKIVVLDGKVVNEEEAARGFVDEVLVAMTQGMQIEGDDFPWIEDLLAFTGADFIKRCAENGLCKVNNKGARWLGSFLHNIAINIVMKPVMDLEAMAKSIDSHMPIEERLAIAEKLESGLVKLAGEGKLSIYRRILSPEDVLTYTGDSDLDLEFGGSEFNFNSAFILAAIRAIRNEKDLMDYIGTVDKVALEKNRLKFGAKGANLLILKNLLDKVRVSEFLGNFSAIRLPAFNLIGVDIYEKWLAGEGIRDDLKKFHGDGALIVRSSAVYSEDGEETTGAGIYESVDLEEDADFEDFVAAVIKVYESCDSDRSVTYRKEHGVEKELMGIVVQIRLEEPKLGRVNSTRPGTDDLTYLKFDHRRAPLVNHASNLDIQLFAGGAHADARCVARSAYVQPDFYHFGSRDITNATIILFMSRVLEKYYGRPVQNEFSIQDHPGRIYFLQCRPLPSKMFNREKVEFPKDKAHFYEGNSEGVCDMELAWLDSDGDNSEKDGLVVFKGSTTASVQMDHILKALPKSGVVVVMDYSTLGKGHIETLALEKGLTLLFGQLESPEGVIDNTRLMVALRTKYMGKLMVVSDGRKGRIYEI